MLKDKYTIDYKSFPDRWAAIAWICANQLHKHNMTELQRMKLYQEEYEARQKSVTNATGRNQYYKEVGEEILHQPNENLIDGSAIPFEYKTGKEPKTREILAREHNVSPGTIQTAVEVGRGIDRAAEVDPDFKREVLSGEVKATKKELSEIRKMGSDEEVAAKIEEIRNPTKERKQSTNPRGYTKEDRESNAQRNSMTALMRSWKSTFFVLHYFFRTRKPSLYIALHHIRNVTKIVFFVLRGFFGKGVFLVGVAESHHRGGVAALPIPLRVCCQGKNLDATHAQTVYS